MADKKEIGLNNAFKIADLSSYQYLAQSLTNGSNGQWVITSANKDNNNDKKI